jgi:drug/metabolite transporter (DMT)-like permease
MNHEAKIWIVLGMFVFFTSAGDVLMAKAMALVGDLGGIRQRHGTLVAIKVVFTSFWFWIAVLAMASSFFSLLTALNWADLSFVGPASSALTFILNTFAGKFYLKERVTARRWLAAGLVCIGVFLISH